MLSVIIPARNCKEDLARCLECLGRSTYRDFEVIVVDDASTDDTVAAIPASQAHVLALPVQSGPAAARNRGAEAARGTYLLFLDADVCVHPETLEVIADGLAAHPEASAVFGSYDTEPQALNILSQYRNLMHHFVHQEAKEEASTFWSGCGVVRRSAFLAVGGFLTDYRRPCTEDIELGVRLNKAGHRIRLDKRVLVTHLKKWTFWGMLKADVRDRALPWSQLILREGNLPNDLNLRLSQRVSALLAVGLFGTLLIAAWHLQLLLALPVVFVIGIVLLDSWSLTRRVPTSIRYLGVLALLGSAGALATYFRVLMLLPLALLAGILVLNWRFYVFLARTRHPLFAAFALPLQVLYYLYSSATFGLAILIHFAQGATGLVRSARGRPGADPAPLSRRDKTAPQPGGRVLPGEGLGPALSPCLVAGQAPQAHGLGTMPGADAP
jgi:GT2 family glycosyltransferase